jgi:heme/copper-type cytochrome/quinol oxidase subunit 2
LDVVLSNISIFFWAKCRRADPNENPASISQTHRSPYLVVVVVVVVVMVVVLLMVFLVLVMVLVMHKQRGCP